MKDNYTVFEFKGYFESDRNSIQYRYVCAETETDAMVLMQKYSDELVRKGFDRFVWFDNPIVNNYSVIGA